MYLNCLYFISVMAKWDLQNATQIGDSVLGEQNNGSTRFCTI